MGLSSVQKKKRLSSIKPPFSFRSSTTLFSPTRGVQRTLRSCWTPIPFETNKVFLYFYKSLKLNWIRVNEPVREFIPDMWSIPQFISRIEENSHSRIFPARSIMFLRNIKSKLLYDFNCDVIEIERWKRSFKDRWLLETEFLHVSGESKDGKNSFMEFRSYFNFSVRSDHFRSQLLVISYDEI